MRLIETLSLNIYPRRSEHMTLRMVCTKRNFKHEEWELEACASGNDSHLIERRPILSYTMFSQATVAFGICVPRLQDFAVFRLAPTNKIFRNQAHEKRLIFRCRKSISKPVCLKIKFPREEDSCWNRPSQSDKPDDLVSSTNDTISGGIPWSFSVQTNSA